MGFTLPYMMDTIGLQLGFLFGGICFVALVFTYLCVPECKGKSLEMIERLFHEGVPSRKFGSYKGDLRRPSEETKEEDEQADGEKGRMGKEEVYRLGD